MATSLDGAALSQRFWRTNGEHERLERSVPNQPSTSLNVLLFLFRYHHINDLATEYCHDSKDGGKTFITIDEDGEKIDDLQLNKLESVIDLVKSDWNKAFQKEDLGYNPEDFINGRFLHSFKDLEDASSSNYLHVLPYLALAYTNLNRLHQQRGSASEKPLYSGAVAEFICEYLQRSFSSEDGNVRPFADKKLDPVRKISAALGFSALGCIQCAETNLKPPNKPSYPPLNHSKGPIPCCKSPRGTGQRSNCAPNLV